VSSIRHGAAEHQALTELGTEAYIARKAAAVREKQPRHPWSREVEQVVRESVDKHAPHWAENAKDAANLPDPVTWESVVQLYNARYHPPDALVHAGQELPADDDRMHYDPVTGSAYTWSTRNPHGKWDYWSIGGRGREHFTAAGAGAGLITTAKRWDSPDEPTDGRVHCDGGPKALLDFTAMRDKAAAEAEARYDQWETICTSTPVAKSWSHFVGLVEAHDLTIGEAREQYWAQPRIALARRTELDSGWGECVVQQFLPGRDEYLAQARAAAVPGYAFVTLDRRWLAPGHMGWFGSSSDGPGEREAYHAEVNRYLDSLNDDDFVVVLDCHV
jgi:hypothetical protein